MFVLNTFLDNLTAAGTNLKVLNDTMTPFLAKIGFSWEDSWKKVEAAALNSNSTNLEVEVYRLLLNITVKVFDVST
jgi:hypothetical protein